MGVMKVQWTFIYTANILNPFFYCEEKHKVQNNPTQNTQLNDLPQSE